MRRLPLAPIALFAVFAIPTAADASPAFPGVIEEQLELAAAPACTLCHTSPSGGSGTANTAFASYLKSRGLRAGDEGSLRNALRALVGEKHDTDNDGVPDDAELKAGEDPNGDVDTSVPPVKYGCGAEIATQPSMTPFGLVLTATALFGMVVRRRKGRPRDRMEEVR